MKANINVLQIAYYPKRCRRDYDLYSKCFISTDILFSISAINEVSFDFYTFATDLPLCC